MLTLASAQAKFILSGEHFVVNGAPCVVIPASCFSTQVSLQDLPGDSISVNCVFENDQPISREKHLEYEQVVSDLIRRAAEMLNIDLGGLYSAGVGLKCTIKSTIPPGQGAGSSSALCQALIEVMLKHFWTDNIHPNYLKWFGTALENEWHGPVSGVDNSAIAYRRIQKFQRGTVPEPLVPGYPLYFVVGSTGPRAQGNPYQGIRYCREKQAARFDGCRKVSTENALCLADAILLGNVRRIGDLMNESHALYNSLEIVTPKMNEAVEEAKSLGAYGARMTGAGGGGFVIACVPIQLVEKVQQTWMKMGLKSIRMIQFLNA